MVSAEAEDGLTRRAEPGRWEKHEHLKQPHAAQGWCAARSRYLFSAEQVFGE